MGMTNKEFAEKNAGKYFRYKRTKVRVVGHYARDSRSILVTLPANGRCLWWGAVAMEDDDVLVVRSRARRYWYVEQCQLEKLK